jgi:uncharacterized protein (DUF433 family)
MLTLKELETQLLSLQPAEQASIIQLLSSNLAQTPVARIPVANSWQGIRKTPDVMGGAACIRETRIPVWLLVSYRNLGLSEVKLLENYPALSATDLANAWAYAATFPNEIAIAIRQQHNT